MPGALERLPGQLRGRLLTLFLIVTFTVWGGSLLVNAPLTTGAAPSGIISFELAATPERAQAILQSWGERQRLLAAFGLGLDYLFLCAYSTFFALACYSAGEAARAAGSRMASLAGPLATAQWVAAGFDAVENLALLCILLGEVWPYWPEIAEWCASVKFALIGCGLIFIIWGTGLRTLEELLGRRI